MEIGRLRIKEAKIDRERLRRIFGAQIECLTIVIILFCLVVLVVLVVVLLLLLHALGITSRGFSLRGCVRGLLPLLLRRHCGRAHAPRLEMPTVKGTRVPTCL